MGSLCPRGMTHPFLEHPFPPTPSNARRGLGPAFGVSYIGAFCLDSLVTPSGFQMTSQCVSMYHSHY